jgi:hypothetical protein
MQVLLAEHRTPTWEAAEATLDALLNMPGNEEMAVHFAR